MQKVKTHMKCLKVQHFIRVGTVCLDKIDLQRRISMVFFFFWGGGGVITLNPLIYLMNHPDLDVENLMEKPIGLQRVNKYLKNIRIILLMIFFIK